MKPFAVEESNELEIRLTNYAGGSDISVVAWNIERGRIFDGILETLKNHDNLKEKDLYLLTELDYGMIRSGNRFVAQEIARELKLNYAFAPVYIALQRGSGIESELEGENKQSIHGLAMFSKFPGCRKSRRTIVRCDSIATDQDIEIVENSAPRTIGNLKDSQGTPLQITTRSRLIYFEKFARY
ncbi:MAG: hypothetical protein WKF71_18855 [Pyrinomonadaceae bacterium]